MKKYSQTMWLLALVLTIILNACQQNKAVKDNNTVEEQGIFLEKNILPSTLTVNEQREIYKKILTLNRSSLVNWFEVGPNDVGGRVRTLVLDRTNTATIIAGGVTGGIWKSIDNGDNWTLVSDPLFNFSITSIVQHPSISTTWYASTGEARSSAADNNSRIFGSGTLYTSTDNGNTWSELASPATTNNYLYVTSKLIISPTTHTFFVATNGFGIARSTDGGLTFNLVLGPNNGSYNFDSSTDDMTHADVVVNSNGDLLAHIDGELADGAGIYKSVDDGLTWQNITPPDYTVVNYKDVNRGIFAFAPSNPNVAYCFSEAGVNSFNDTKPILFHKIDFAKGTFLNRSQNLPKLTIGGVTFLTPGPQSSWNMALSVKPDDENFVVIGGASGSPFRSQDGYATDHGTYPSWNDLDTSNNRVSQEYLHNDQHVLVFDPSNPNILWSGNDGGIGKCEDVLGDNDLNSWDEKNNGLNITQFYSVGIAPSSFGNNVIGGTQDNGHRTMIWNQNNTSPTFKRPVTGGDGIGAYWGENYIFMTGIGGPTPGIMSNQGFTTGDLGEIKFPKTHHSDFLPNTGYGNNGQHFAVNPNNEDVIFMHRGGSVLFRGTNAISWVTAPTQSDITNAIESLSITDVGITNTFNISFLALKYAKAEDALYFSTSTNGWDNDQTAPQLFKLSNASTAQLSTAVEISSPLFPNQGQIVSIALNPIDANEIVAVLSDNDKVSLFHSTDGGTSFEAVEGNLSTGNYSPAYRDLVIATTSNNEKIYFLSTTMGLYSAETLQGNSTVWSLESPDVIGTSFVSSLDYREDDQMLAVGTHGRGIFMGEITSSLLSLGKEVLNDNNLMIYPNPSTGNFQIAFEDTKNNDEIEIKIIDIKGTLIEQRVFNNWEELSQFKFNLSTNSPGIYLIKFESGNKIATRKIILKN